MMKLGLKLRGDLLVGNWLSARHCYCSLLKRSLHLILYIKSQVHPDADRVASVLSRPEKVAPFALFECAFFKEKGFLSHETQLLDNCATIAHLPVSIVHGRQDVVCRPAGAWKLHKRLPRSNIEFIAGAGHSNSEPDIEVALVKATDGMKNI